MTFDTVLLVYVFAIILLALGCVAWYLAWLQYLRTKQILFLVYDWLQRLTHHEQNYQS